MKFKKYISIICIIGIAAAVLAGCGGSSGSGAASYKDGTYEGKSAVYEGDEDGNGDGYGVATITIKDNKIVECEYYTYQTDGTLKDEDYGKQNGAVANTDFYNKAQRAVLACQEYAKQLAEVGDLSGVDAISGATISYNELIEAVNNALDQAKE